MSALAWYLAGYRSNRLPSEVASESAPHRHKHGPSIVSIRSVKQRLRAIGIKLQADPPGEEAGTIKVSGPGLPYSIRYLSKRRPTINHVAATLAERVLGQHERLASHWEGIS